MRRLVATLIRWARHVRATFPVVLLALCVMGMWLVSGAKKLRRNHG